MHICCVHTMWHGILYTDYKFEASFKDLPCMSFKTFGVVVSVKALEVMIVMILQMERINVGMHVDIRRSDGRVHNAIISEVRKGTQSVTVEWFENVNFLSIYIFYFT